MLTSRFQVMKEESLVVVKIVVRMIGILRESWLAGATTHEDFLVVFFGHKVSTSGGENPWSDLHWLYLEMADLYLSPC